MIYHLGLIVFEYFSQNIQDLFVISHKLFNHIGDSQGYAYSFKKNLRFFYFWYKGWC